MITERYHIGGMSCAACSASVERVTGRMEGVEKSAVNLATGELRIVYDETVQSPATIIAKIEKAGFTAKPWQDSDKADRDKEEKELERFFLRLIIAICFAVPLLYISMGHMLKFPLPKAISPDTNPLVYALIQLFLTIPVLVCGRKYYFRGFKSLFKLNPNMDSLVAIGTTAAFVYSVVMLIKIPSDANAVHNLYFESSAVVLTLIMVGKYLEARSKGKTKEAINKLMALVPPTVHRFAGDSETVEEIPVEHLFVGDRIFVGAGECIPADGTILSGAGAVNEAMLTGESIPVDKAPGDKVTGGSINGDCGLVVRVNKVGADTTLAKIIALMEEAQGRKAPIARIADRVAGIFVPAVMGIAVLAAVIWLIAGKDLSFVVNIFVSVLVIACPCALGLATPTAILVGTGLGASNGILIRSGEALEQMKKIDIVILDKTGTVTSGEPRVTQVVPALKHPLSLPDADLLAIAAAAELGSSHPIAKAIIVAAQSGPANCAVKSFKNHTGLGIEAEVKYNGDILAVKIGNIKFFADEGLTTEEQQVGRMLDAEGALPIYMRINGEFAGAIGISDEIKEESIEAISELKSQGMHVVLLTGDRKSAADAVCERVGADYAVSEVMPDEKAKVVRAFQNEGNRVMMVGDGINDAPALAEADVGVAIGGGSDIAVESADVILMKSRLSDIPRAVNLSRLTIKKIKQNLFWAFFYNSLGLPLAAGVLYPLWGILLNPMIGGFAMSLSSVCVVTNALRLKNKKL